MAWSSALRTLPRMGGEPRGGLSASALRSALRSPDPAVRAHALDAVALGPGVEEMLVVALGDGSSRVRRAAARAIGRIDGPLATRALLERSSADLSPAVRAEAASALGRILRERASTSGDAAPST